MANDRHPPGPAGHWLLGNVNLLRRDVLEWLEELPREYGDVIRLRFGPYNTVLLSHPSYVQQVLVAQGKKFDKPPRFLRIIRPAFGKGLIANRGDSWEQQRRRMQSAVDEVECGHHCMAVVESVERTIATWSEVKDHDLARRMMTLALAVRARTTLGIEQTRAFESMHDAVREFMDYYATSLQSPVAWPLWIPTGRNRRMRSALKRWRGTIEDQIEKAILSDQGDCHLLSSLLHLGQSGAEFAMTRRQLRDELATWLLAGTETSANTLAWACYALARNVIEQDRLCEEVQSSLLGQPPQPGDLPKLELVKRLLLEVMRLYPQAYLIGRKARQSFRVGDLTFPKKTTVILNQWSIGRDRRWFDNPEQFSPDRWAGDLLERLPQFAFFPFGGGGRICIGRSLAMLELPLILAMLVQRFRFTLTPDAKVHTAPSLTLRPVWKRGAIVISHR